MRIRKATVEDAAAIASVHVASRQATYRGVIADDVLDGPELPVNRLRLWQRIIGGNGPQGHTVLVAERDGVVGLTDVGPSRDEDAGIGTGEVVAIYALPDVWGASGGPALAAS